MPLVSGNVKNGDQLIITLHENMEMTINQLQMAIENFTYPIFQMNRNNRFELIASSVAIELGGAHFLCTAAHVIEHGSLYIGNSKTEKKGQFISLKGDSIFTKKESESEIDFDLCLIDADKIKNKLNFCKKEELKGA